MFSDSIRQAIALTEDRLATLDTKIDAKEALAEQFHPSSPQWRTIRRKVQALRKKRREIEEDLASLQAYLGRRERAESLRVS